MRVVELPKSTSAGGIGTRQRDGWSDGQSRSDTEEDEDDEEEGGAAYFSPDSLNGRLQRFAM